MSSWVTASGLIRRELGHGTVIDDPGRLAEYTRDWTGRFEQLATVAVRPRTRDDVATVLRICTETKTPVVPRGGGTGLVGGSRPHPQGLLLDLRALGGVTIDAASRTAWVGAGVTVAEIQTAAAEHGLTYPVDLASRDSATIGGTIATNAGGLLTLRHGGTRQQVLGVEAVLADGHIGSVARALPRDNVGYHLPSLLSGSEGTLGVITAAVLRLTPTLPSRATALLAFHSIADGIQAATRLGVDPAVQAVEFMRQSGIDLVCNRSSLRRPMRDDHEAYMLIEVATPANAHEALATVIEGIVTASDVAVGWTQADRQALWSYRELHTESIGTLGPVHKLDVAVPPAALPALIETVETEVARGWPAATSWFFGHVAEGSVHVNITGVPADDTAVDDCVLRVVLDLGGSISAEHGIGRAKLTWVNHARTSAETRTAHAVKQALDPLGLLNPGVLLPPVRSAEGTGI